jgi:DNA invertase Pin-like site-specific DNA recombinase
MVGELRRRKIGFTSLHDNLGTTPGGRLAIHVFAALTEFIVAGTRDSLAAAKAYSAPSSSPPTAAHPRQLDHLDRQIAQGAGSRRNAQSKQLGHALQRLLRDQSKPGSRVAAKLARPSRGGGKHGA